MKVTLTCLLLSLLMLAVPASLLRQLDRPQLSQSAVVVLRVAAALLLLALCLHYLFVWDKAWVNVLWMLLSGGVATALYCRKRWLAVPIYVSMTICSLAIGLLVLLLTTPYYPLLSAQSFVPVMAVLQADALFVGRRGLAVYVLNCRQHKSLEEYLRGNGAGSLDALRPFVAVAVKRAFVPVLSMLLLVGIVFMPSMLSGLLLAGVAPLQALSFVAVLTVGGMCCSILSLLLSIVIYTKLKN